MVYTAHIDPARGIVEITDSNGVRSTHKPDSGSANFAPIVQARVLLKLAGYMPVNGSMRVDWGPGDCGLIRDADDRMRARLIERLLCTGRTDAACLRNETATAALLKQLEDRRLVIRDGSEIEMTDAGRPYARVLAALFDPKLPAIGTGSLAA